MQLNRLIHGDCLEVMKEIPDKSIHLIIADIPYNIGKDKRWDKWKKQNEYIEFIGSRFLECQRVLRDNGSFYWFHNDFIQIVELQNWINKNTRFAFKSLVTIDKLDNTYIKDLYGARNHFRNYLNLAEYVLFYTFQDETGLSKVMGEYDIFKSIKEYLRSEKKRYENGGNDIRKSLRWTKHFHSFAEGKSFGFPTLESYTELQQKTGCFQKPYESLRQEYESLRYTFNKKDGLKNVWEYSFREDKKEKHPTQKPISLISDIINYSSNENDIILDPFSGSGTTAIACMNTKRNYICIEKDLDYYNSATKRINDHLSQTNLFKPAI